MMMILPNSAHHIQSSTWVANPFLECLSWGKRQLRINCSEIEERILVQRNTSRVSTLSCNEKQPSSSRIHDQLVWALAHPSVEVSPPSFQKEHWHEHVPGPYSRHLIQRGVNSAKASQKVRKRSIFFSKFCGTPVTTPSNTLDVQSKKCPP